MGIMPVITNDFSMVSFFLTSLAVTLLSCPVTSRVYRTHDAIVIEADDISRGDAADSSQLNNAAVLRYRRSLSRMDPGRSCTSMSGSAGFCTTLYSCYPNLSQSQLSIQEIGMIVARSKCQYLGIHDEQVTGICCSEPHVKGSSSFVSDADQHIVSPSLTQFDSNSMTEIHYQSSWESTKHDLNLLNPFRPLTIGGGSDKHDATLNNQLVTKQQQQQFHECGRGPAQLPPKVKFTIDGGTEAQKNSWPFLVALRFDGTVKCGGTLISFNKILTAAHCVERLSSFDISKMTVSLGMHTIGNGVDSGNDAQVTRRVSRAVIHNGYNDATTVDDIAILTLDSPVVYSNAISPICLPVGNSEADQYAGQEVAMMGWGDLKFEKTRSISLQQVKGTVVTNTQCMDDYGILNITTKMFCVSSPMQSACQGDSGGPVAMQSSSGSWTVVGINSFALECGLMPGVKTKVLAFRKWIDFYMK